MKRKYSLVKSFLSFFLCFMLSMTYVMAQQTVTGTVKDENGEAIPGANVIIKGTNGGATTDLDGKFSVKVPSSESILVISFVGYQTQEITVGAQSIIDVQLQVDAEVLDEVVVIGYGGAVKKEDATGSVTTVNTEKFNKGFVTSAQDLLVGRAAGVQITATDGTPGGGSAIRIRGGSSLSASNNPLIVIDGVLVSDEGQSGMSNPLAAINPNDIASMTILKDASATAIYGARASNGVIIVTTKKGKDGKPRFTYSGNFGVNTLPNQLSVLNGTEYAALINDRIAQGDANVPAEAANLLGSANTNWQDEIFQTALTTDHNLAVGGTFKGRLPFRASIGYTDQEGTLKTSKFQRTTMTLRLDPEFLNGDLKVSVTGKAMLAKNTFAETGAIGSAVSYDPTQPVFSDGSPYGGYFFWPQTSDPTLPITIGPKNPVAMLAFNDNQADVNRFILNGQVDYSLPFAKGLKAHVGLGTDRTKTDGRRIVSGEYEGNVNTGTTTTVYTADYENDFFESYLNYNTEFGASKLDVQGGYTWQHFYRINPSATTQEIGTNPPAADGDPSENFLVSFFGRMQYSLKDKYLFTFTFRRDGSSRFAEGNQWGNFPSAAFAWKLKEEAFLKDVDFIQSLKLRLGYGVTGQENVGSSYPAIGIVTAAESTANVQFGSTFVSPLRFEGFDANLKWEETTTYNAGLDFALTKSGRLIGSIDYYFRETRDLLNVIPVPQGTNFTNQILTNIGNLENEGIEVSLDATLIEKSDFTLDFGVNFTRNVNKITKLTAVDDPTYLGVSTGATGFNDVQIHQVGAASNTFFLYEQVYDETGNPIQGLYVDQNEDGVINNFDQVANGNPVPDYYMGFSTRLNYKNFSFSANARMNVGNKVFNSVEASSGNYQGLYNSNGYLNNVVSASANSQFTAIQSFSDFYLRDASFFRMDNITLGYNLPKLANDKVNLRVNLTVQNAFVITDYTGLDPEVGGGIDNNFYPRPRIFVLGLNANF